MRERYREREREKYREGGCGTKCVNATVVQLWVSSCLGRPHGMVFHFRKGLHAFVWIIQCKLRRKSFKVSLLDGKSRAKKDM